MQHLPIELGLAIGQYLEADDLLCLRRVNNPTLNTICSDSTLFAALQRYERHLSDTAGQPLTDMTQLERKIDLFSQHQDGPPAQLLDTNRGLPQIDSRKHWILRGRNLVYTYGERFKIVVQDILTGRVQHIHGYSYWMEVTDTLLAWTTYGGVCKILRLDDLEVEPRTIPAGRGSMAGKDDRLAFVSQGTVYVYDWNIDDYLELKIDFDEVLPINGLIFEDDLHVVTFKKGTLVIRRIEVGDECILKDVWKVELHEEHKTHQLQLISTGNPEVWRADFDQTSVLLWPRKRLTTSIDYKAAVWEDKIYKAESHGILVTDLDLNEIGRLEHSEVSEGRVLVNDSFLIHIASQDDQFLEWVTFIFDLSLLSELSVVRNRHFEREYIWKPSGDGLTRNRDRWLQIRGMSNVHEGWRIN